MVKLEGYYGRDKGIDSRLIDRPMKSVIGEYQLNVEHIIKHHEPRVMLRGLNLSAINAGQGDFKINTRITPIGGA